MVSFDIFKVLSSVIYGRDHPLIDHFLNDIKNITIFACYAVYTVLYACGMGYVIVWYG